MGFYYVYQYKPISMPTGKHLNVSDEFLCRDKAKLARSKHMIDDPDCVFSEIIEANTEKEVLQKVSIGSLNRL
ncbi:TPA: hypothetical protein ACNV1G_004115 [Citrobacter amalonaticus]